MDIRGAPILIVIGALLVSGCGSTGPDTLGVSVTGTLTMGGQPATGDGLAELGVDGESEPVYAYGGEFDGTYGLAGEVDASKCSRLYVYVGLVDVFGQTVGQATEPLHSCGTHVLDLVLVAP